MDRKLASLTNTVGISGLPVLRAVSRVSGRQKSAARGMRFCRPFHTYLDKFGYLKTVSYHIRRSGPVTTLTTGRPVEAFGVLVTVNRPIRVLRLAPLSRSPHGKRLKAVFKQSILCSSPQENHLMIKVFSNIVEEQPEMI